MSTRAGRQLCRTAVGAGISGVGGSSGADDGAVVPGYGDSLVYALVKVAHLVECRTNSSLGDEALSLRQLNVLAYIHEHAEVGQRELAEHVLTSPQAARALVGRLVSLGLVKRFDRGSGRPALLELTDAGRSALVRARTLLQSTESVLFGELSTASQTSLRHLLANVVSCIQPDDLISRS